MVAVNATPKKDSVEINQPIPVNVPAILMRLMHIQAMLVNLISPNNVSNVEKYLEDVQNVKFLNFLFLDLYPLKKFNKIVETNIIT